MAPPSLLYIRNTTLSLEKYKPCKVMHLTKLSYKKYRVDIKDINGQKGTERYDFNIYHRTMMKNEL